MNNVLIPEAGLLLIMEDMQLTGIQQGLGVLEASKAYGSAVFGVSEVSDDWTDSDDADANPKADMSPINDEVEDTVSPAPFKRLVLFHCARDIACLDTMLILGCTDRKCLTKLTPMALPQIRQPRH